MRILLRAFLLGSVLVSAVSSAQQSPLNYASRVDGIGSLVPDPALAIGSNARDSSTANEVPSTSQVLVPTVGELQEVTVTTSRLSLIGTATTASQGVVVNDEIALTPAYRPGQLLETVPGLEVTLHSGEGKANQYLMRGYNLDHGTDLATFVDGMPINEPTHAHGQGYTDLNFMIPALATNIAYTKGTYYADEGDFASVGSVHLSYLDSIDSQAAASSGTFGFEHFFTAGSTAAGSGHVLGALELQHYDGPWINPDDQRKINAVLRYSEGNGHDGYSVTGMFYHDLWNSSTDQPARAITDDLINRFGSLDPSDGGQAQRASLSLQYRLTIADGQLNASAYVINNQLTLWNNFTHFLVDPVNGDQEAQHEARATVGAAISYVRAASLAGFENELLAGVITRHDSTDVSRLPAKDRLPIPAADDPLNFSESDAVRLTSIAGYVQATTRWTDWFRSVLGVRADTMSGTDSGTNAGTASSALLQPKASLILRLAASTEFYLSAGRGFHSNDLRGVTHALATGESGVPLIASQTGAELGIRQQFLRTIALTVAVYTLHAQSETTYDPDAGIDVAGPASRRRGFEVNLTYQALRWLEFYGSYSANRARFDTSYNDGTGHVGYFLPNAPFATGSFNAYVKNLGPWSGGLEYRYLGAFPLSADNQVKGHGYGEWNADAHYAFANGWGAALGIYDVLDLHANAAEFWYVDRLAEEPAGGIADLHVHPLEPRSVRVTVSKSF
ncbi:MAG TPA: TonB-dependent receptor plug domain-containing protein [Candidatus Margulisiibacteriota bacterium]|nr:TonB-dependent receptor plug domain-containing protein [Candidatus Margulisiibacteriota bacterium]